MSKSHLLTPLHPSLLPGRTVPRRKRLGGRRLAAALRRGLPPVVRVLAALFLVLSSLPLSVLVPPASLLAPQTAQAAVSFTVNSTLDAVDAAPGDGACATATGTVPASACTLRAAIMEANALPGDDTITLPAGTYTLTIAGQDEDGTTTGDLDITDNLTITGAGAASTIIQACDAGANPDCTGIDRVFHVLTGATVTISGVTIRKGNAASNNGGGIYSSGMLTVSQSTISGNSAAYGGGISNTGDLTASQGTISGNSASYGGGIYNTGTLTVSQSTVSGNSAATFTGGGISNLGSLTVSQSTVSGNSAGTDAGGIYNGGNLTVNNSTVSGNSAGADAGGIYNNDGTATVSNSTISGNVAVSYGGGIKNDRPITVVNSTLYANSAAQGAGIISDHLRASAAFSGTIVAGSIGGPNCSGTITSNGYNLSSDATCSLAGAGDLENTDPLLGPLQDNGGPTQTHALLVGSPAIDAVPTANCTDADGNPLTVDQREAARPQGTACDIGAFEVQVATALAFTTQPGGGAAGQVWAQQPVVEVRDAYNKPVLDATLDVMLGITTGTPTTGGPGALTCTTNPVAAVGGVATFTGCAIATAGTGYTLTASASGLTAAVSAPFTIAATTVPQSCQEIRTADPSATDGEYTIAPNGQPFTVYCYDMAGTPREYLTLLNTGGSFNFGQYTAGGASAGTTVTTHYTRVRIDPATFLVNIADQTFASSTGSLLHSPDQVTSMPYGVAMDCIGGVPQGRANIDLRGTPFAVVDPFQSAGSAGSTTFSANSQVVDLTGGGFCGWNAPASDPALYNPYNTRPSEVNGGFVLDLTYVGFLPTPTQLVFVTQPGGGAAGQVWAQQPVVEARDANGNPVATDPDSAATETVTVAFTAGTNTEGATLGGTLTAPIDWATGRASFTNLSVDLVGSYGLTASTNLGSFTADSSAFSIVPPVPALAAVTTGEGNDATALLGEQVTLTGGSFGSPAAGGRSTPTTNVRLGGPAGFPIPDAAITAWTGTQITFFLPAGAPGGAQQVVV
ncbi:MAG: hypothetical protein HY689_10985, partial [Chloroflexi bacterium]|nr:hypothetical protein [Chloroflexota bacterium]